MSKSKGSIFDRGSLAQNELAAAVAQEYQLNPAGFRGMHEDREADMLEFVFARPPLPPNVKAVSAKLDAILSDPFRGPVIFASTPEFAEEVKRLLTALGDNGLVHIRVDRRLIDKILKRYLYGPFPSVSQNLSGWHPDSIIVNDPLKLKI